MSVNANVAKSVAEEGGIKILACLAKSMNRLVAEEAAGGLWNLSVGEEHKVSLLIIYKILVVTLDFSALILFVFFFRMLLLWLEE